VSQLRAVIIAMLIIVGMLWVAFGLLHPRQIEKANSPHSGQTYRKAAMESGSSQIDRASPCRERTIIA
jgi:hypothetical protein